MTRFRVDIRKWSPNGYEDYGSCEDIPHLVSRYLADMSRRLRREAALMDDQEMAQFQEPLPGVGNGSADS